MDCVNSSASVKPEETMGNKPNVLLRPKTPNSEASSSSSSSLCDFEYSTPSFISGAFLLFVAENKRWEKCTYILKRNGDLRINIRRESYFTNMKKYDNEDGRIGRIVFEIPEKERLLVLLPSKESLLEKLLMIPLSALSKHVSHGINEWKDSLWIQFENSEGLVKFVEYISETLFRRTLMFDFISVVEKYEQIYRTVHPYQRTTQ